MLDVKCEGDSHTPCVLCHSFFGLGYNDVLRGIRDSVSLSDPRTGC